MTEETKAEIEGLAAETLALQVLFTSLVRRLAQGGPALHALVSETFDDAADMVEQIALAHAGATHTGKALEIIETLRAASVPSQSEPKHGI